ncbi:MAG: hypothetical protein ABI813_01650 [Bacteroidota bacterium]
MESEIHIISIEAKELDMVYVLNPELKSKGFPDSFEIGKVEASFKQKKGLLISGSGPDCGEYSILIQPTGKDCEEPDISAYYSGKSLFEKLPG